MLEIGTFSGHSALAMAAALPEGGRIDACEIRPLARVRCEIDRASVHMKVPRGGGGVYVVSAVVFGADGDESAVFGFGA